MTFGGYSIVQAQSHDAAAKLFGKSHPHLQMMPGGRLEIVEIMPDPWDVETVILTRGNALYARARATGARGGPSREPLVRARGARARAAPPFTGSRFWGQLQGVGLGWRWRFELGGMCAMARSKPTEETMQRVMAEVLEEARANNKLPGLLAGIVQNMRDSDPEGVDTALKSIIEQMAASLPEHKRHKFLEELLAFVRPN